MAQEARRKEFEARMLASAAARSAKEQVREDRVKDSAEASSAAQVTQKINQCRTDIQKILQEARSAGGSSENTSMILQKASNDCLALQEYINKSAHIMSGYDLRQAQQVVQAVEKDISAAKGDLAPKKKFSFSRAGKAESPSPSLSPSPPAPTAASAAAELIAEQVVAASPSASVPSQSTSAGGFVLRDQSGQTIRLRESELPDAADVTLMNLERCIVYITRPISALHIDGLKDCRVYVGPVNGSVRVVNATGSTIQLASRQLRIHDSVDCSFLLLVASNPIIERSSRLRFGPYCFQYEGLTAQLQQSALPSSGSDSDSALWSKVEDFNWLRATASPNWSLIPPEELATFKVVSPT